MQQLKAAVDRALEAVDRVFADKKQFRRHLINPGKEDMEERVLHKVDTRALKEATSVLKDLAGLMAELEGGQTAQGVHVIFDAGEEDWND